VLLTLAFAGNALGSSGTAPEMRPPVPRLAVVVLNLFCLYLAVGGFTWWISCLSDRRGRAMGTVFAVLLASFLLNYLAQFWDPAKHAAFLSILSYYRPYFILRDGAWPAGHLATLAGVGAGFWILGGVHLSRRDLTTV
jgi:ABC-2 type transport system permease protein